MIQVTVTMSKIYVTGDCYCSAV